MKLFYFILLLVWAVFFGPKTQQIYLKTVDSWTTKWSKRPCSVCQPGCSDRPRATHLIGRLLWIDPGWPKLVLFTSTHCNPSSLKSNGAKMWHWCDKMWQAQDFPMWCHQMICCLFGLEVGLPSKAPEKSSRLVAQKKGCLYSTGWKDDWFRPDPDPPNGCEWNDFPSFAAALVARLTTAWSALTLGWNTSSGVSFPWRGLFFSAVPKLGAQQ